MFEKNTTLERRSARVPTKSSKRSSTDESVKKPVSEIERMVSDAGLKRKQGAMDVKDSKKLISFIEAKISKAEEGQYVRLVPDIEITRAKINTFVNITETWNKLSQWLSSRQYEAVKDQPCIQFMHLETLSWAGQVFHNIVMRLTNHSAMGDALWFELGEDLGRFSINEFCLIIGLNCVGSTHLPVVKSRLISIYFSTVRGVLRENLELQMSNAKFDNDDDAVKLSLLYIIFCIPLSNVSSVKIDPKFFALANNLDVFNDFPWGMLSWEATWATICDTVENMMSSKRRPLKKNIKVHYSILGFPHALLVWAYETLPSIASKFTTKYDQAILHMMSWTTADNVMFDDVLAAFTTLKCFVLKPTEEELKNPWVTRLFLKNPNALPQLPPPKSSVPRSSTDINSEWREFQKEIREKVASLNKKLEDLKKEQKHSNKLLRRVLKMLSTNMIEKGQGKAQTVPHVSSSQEINVQRAESDTFNTTSPDIGAVADMGVQAAMEFLTANKVMSSHEDAENEKNKVNIKDRLEGNEGEANVKSEQFVEIKDEIMPDLENGVKEEKDDKEIIREQDVIKLEEPANEESIGAVVPKKKRAKLSRLGQRPSGRMTEVGSLSKAPSKLIYALPPGFADEPPKETLEDKRPPRYNAKQETLNKPHDLGFIVVDKKKNWYYELATSPVWLWDEHIDVAFYYLRKKIRQFPELEQRKVTMVDTFFSSKVCSLWRVYQSSPDKFDWGFCESILKIMLSVCVQSGSSWFEVNILLIPIHLADLKHWALVKLDLTS
ncbi:hypothetical protein TIFTF001_030401 [Ficus carica]|uniref:Ubiquitin-like protease family profile domain-containing protein n=1 Tax=Ficus carica TaxID=3494 RepID=A0AA88J4V8_FICCA|nr:hypothetical protein TIFTF001_030338 [Ficus carica]GMN61311.1 hypothetical protein TIFTF001_030401 [Ficus carica]